MKLELSKIFQIQGGLNVLGGIVFWGWTVSVLQLSNMEPTSDLITMTQAFGTMFIVVGIIGYTIPSLAGININRAAKMFVLVNLLWSGAIAYHLISGATSGDVHFGSLILNLIFAALYYIKSR